MVPLSNTVTLFAILLAVAAGCRQPLTEARAKTVSLYFAGDASARGSGLLMNSGAVLTCAHVILPGGPRSPRIRAGDVQMVMLYSDPAFDLAVLIPDGSQTRVSGDETWAARHEAAPGDEVAAVGSPFGLADSFMRGSISHMERSDPAYPGMPFIQVQGVAFPGMSGAPVFHRKGILGIVRASYGSASSGIGLVIPSGYVREFLNRAARQ